MTALIRFMDWPLRAKMAAVFVLASILPSVISTLVNTPDVRQQFVWAGVSILMVLVFGICFAAVILKPVGSLSKGIELIAGGDLGARVHLDHTDELGLLCARFNFMAERIEVQAHALKTAREELAARVQERTMELVQTAKDLQVETSDRNRAQETVRKSEAQLQTIVESLDEGVVVSDLNGRLLRFNRAARDLHGFTSPEECLRCAPEFADTFELKAMDGAILPLDQWPVSRILRHGELRDMEVRIRRIHGDWERVFNYGGALVKDITGQPLMVVITIADITARKRAAEEIRQLNAELEDRVVERTAQLQSANQELEAFSYSVSHDLRAPLRAVDGFSQALLEDYGPLLPAEGKRYLNTIREGTQRMGALIDDLLAFARLSRQPLNKSSVDTGKLVRNVLEDLSMQREGRQIELRIGDLSPCQGDPSLLMQVWTNLLSNALKYTRRRESAVVEVGCASGAGETVYFVRDNGTGFDMQYADKLFGVFQRFHHAEEFEGTGVGLAIAERVIHRHGGRIWADAAVDRGATFYFNLGVEKV